MRSRIAIISGVLLTLSAASVRTQETGGQPASLAVIVHPDNPVTDLKLRELRSIFKLERQFWPNRRRSVLLLPRRESAGKKLLLRKVYRMSSRQLQKYLLNKVFTGEIPEIPAVVRSATAAGELVKRNAGAITVVLSTEVPEGVRTLSINGKRPGDAGYPLYGG